MSGSGKDVVPPAPVPSGPGRGRPKKVRPRENEAGNGTGNLAEVKRRRKSSSAGGETGELGARNAVIGIENETNVVEPVARSAVRIESQSTKKWKQSAVKGTESGTGLGLVPQQGVEADGQEEEKIAALEAVLQVHGVCAQANGGAAAFPGEAGQGTGDQPHSCACCIQPEIVKLTLICDGCDKTFHVTCLSLDLQSATGFDDWLCTSCRAAYLESEVASDVSKIIRRDIERNLFSQERRAHVVEGLKKEPRAEVANGLDNGQSVTAVKSTPEQTFRGLIEQTLLTSAVGKVCSNRYATLPVNEPNMFIGDSLKHSSTQQSVLSQRPLLDLNKVDECAVADSSRKEYAIDLNVCKAPEFEEDVLMADVKAELPEVETGALNDLNPESGNREPCINSSVARLEPIVLEESKEESLGIKSAVAESSFVQHREASSDIGSCINGNKQHIIAEATAATEANTSGFLEDHLVNSRSRPISGSVDLQVQNEKPAFTLADSKAPQIPDKASDLKKDRSTDLAAVYNNGNEEALAGLSIPGGCLPITQNKPLASPRGDVLDSGRSMMSSADLSPEEKIHPASTVEVAAAAFANGSVVSTDNALRVDATITDVPQEVLDARKCVAGNDLRHEGGRGTTEQSDKTAEPSGNDANNYKPEHLLEPIVDARSKDSGDHAKGTTIANFSTPSVSTLVITTSQTSTVDAGGAQTEGQQAKKAADTFASPVSNPDKASVMTTALKTPLTGKLVEVTPPSGPEDQLLKKVGAETLQQLKDSVQKKHGLILADGWEVEVRKRKNDKHLDKYYISPDKHRFRSRIEVMKHLGLWDTAKCSPQEGAKLKCEAQQLHFKESSPIVQRGAGGNIQLPLNLGDFTLEFLGAIDLRPGYWDEQHIWPVGYRCTWHDRTTSSFCISEVADGGCSGPIFRVTRKYCSTIVDLHDSKRDAVNVIDERCGIIVKDSQGYKEDIMTASADGMPSFSPIPTSQFGAEEGDSLKPLPDNSSFPVNVSQEAETLLRDSRSGGILHPQDSIGEFTVEASSTVEAWRRYADKFIERCGKLSDDESVVKACPHRTTAFLGLVSVEIRDPANRLGKLGEDRFGLNQVQITELIEALPNSDRCSGYRLLKERSTSRKAGNLVEAPVQPQRIRIRDKARKQKRSLEVQAAETVAAAAEPIQESSKGEVDTSVVLPVSRQPPPPGQPLELRLPSEYVGDVLQIWEFLCRFSSLIGFSQPPSLDDLEEGLSCGTANLCGHADQSDFLNVRCGDTSALASRPESEGRFCISGDVPHTAPSSATLETVGSPRTPMNPGRSNLGTPAHVSQGKDQGYMERLAEEDGKPIESPSNAKVSLMGVGTDHEVFSTDAHAKLVDPKLIEEPGLDSAASLHVPMIKFLIGDLQSKICGFEELPVESEEVKHKRGRKRVRDIVANACFGREKLTDSFSINELTWPEVARRYIISLSRIKEIGETAEFGREECMKILRCIQGDGGVLCGAIDGVAGMEIDAQLLAEAEKEISSLMPQSEDSAAPSTPPLSSSAKDSVEDFRSGDTSGECPLWIKHLDPIAKLPTNVGSRIRNRVLEALAANPPPWAAEILEYSISKNVYKGNASGPTKRAVMEVLHKFRGEDPGPKVKKTKKQRKRVLPSPEVVMQRCRIVLRQVATADTLRVVSRSYKCMTNFYESEGEGLLARPLDFRAIDLRLGAGAYGTSPDAFAADMKQIWKNLAEIYEEGSAEASAAVELTGLFNSLYKKQVTLFQRGGEQAANTGSDKPEGKSETQSKDGSQKNATEERPPGSDTNKPVKAPWEDDSCQVCGIDDDHDNVLLCDGCDAEYHIYCLNPPLPEVPDGNWFCNSCVAVDTEFLEPPPAPETSSEIKAPEKQQEDHEMGGPYLEAVTEREQSPTSAESTLPSLSVLASQLAATDYWHVVVAERVHLLKWLCDQALETRQLRTHMEKSMDVAVDLQQGLRALLRAERRKNADSDEATKLDSGKDGSREGSIQSMLQTRSAAFKRADELDDVKSVQVYAVDGSSASGSSAGTAATNTVSKWEPVASLGPEEHAAVESGTLRGSSQNLLSAKNLLTDQEGINVANVHAMHGPVLDPLGGVPSNPVVPTNGQQLNGQDVQNLPFADRSIESAGVPLRTNFQVLVEPRNLFSSCDGDIESGRKLPKDEPFSCPEVEVATQDDSLEQKSSSFLTGEVHKVNTNLLLVNGRRELLGRDEMGRVYWALCGAGTAPWLAVVSNTDQTDSKDGLCLGSSPLISSVEKLEGSDTLRMQGSSSKPDESSILSATDVNRSEAGEVQGQQRQLSSWHIYSSESVVDQLIGWLSSTSNMEVSLRSKLLQWKSLFLFSRDAQKAGNLRRGLLASPRSRGDGSKITNSQTPLPEDVRKRIRSFMPALRASSLLEWKCGQSGDTRDKPSAAFGGSKKGRKRKTQQPLGLTRCDCLEPVWASRCHCMVCHTTYETEGDFQAHTTGGTCKNAGGRASDRQGDMRSGKRPCLNSRTPSAAADLQKAASTSQLPAGINTLPDVSKMPMIVRESLQDRVKRIGYGPEKGALFAPGLVFSPVFDPALTMVDTSTMNNGSEMSAEGVLGTIVVGATSSINPAGENSLNGCIVGDIYRRENTESRNSADVASGRTSMPVAGDGPLSTDVVDLTRNEEANSAQIQPAVSAPAHGNVSLGACDLSDEPNGRTSGREGQGKIFRVTGKQLTIPESSLRPLDSEEDLNVLQQLKAKLLDIEAAVTQDMSEKARAYPRRRQAWRSMLKMGMSIYKVVQAIILLEQMVCADFLRTSWCYWSSLTVAAKTATLSSLFLRVYALDAVILYEKSESYAGADLTNRQVKQGKQVKEREGKKNSSVKPPRKKKKEERIAVS